jgi:hypothetical protein
MYQAPRSFPRGHDYIEAMAYERLDTLRRLGAQARLAAEARRGQQEERPRRRWTALVTLCRKGISAQRMAPEQAGA